MPRRLPWPAVVAGVLSIAALLDAGCRERAREASRAPSPASSQRAAPTASAASADSARLSVAVDARIELLSAIFRLAGLPRYGEASTPYARAVDARLAPLEDHRAVRFTEELGRKYHYGYEMAPRLAVHLDDALSPRAPLSPLPPELARWKTADLEIYLDAVRDFAAKARWKAFFAAHRAYFDDVAARDRTLLAKAPTVAWFDAAFGPRPRARYHLAPGLLTGPMDYAAHVVVPGGDEEVYIVAHLDHPDEAGVPQPTEGALPFVVHELCHTYTNPIVDGAMQTLEPVAAPTLDAAAGRMKAQAYATHAIVLEESVVRAVVVLWRLDHGGRAAADEEIAAQERLGFTWTRALADALDAARARHGGALPSDAIVAATQGVFAKP